MPQNVLTNKKHCAIIRMTRNVAMQKGGEKMEMTAGQKLRSCRESLNKSIDEVAKAVGISYQAMQAYETDERTPRDHIKIKIAKFYGTTIGFLFFNE